MSTALGDHASNNAKDEILVTRLSSNNDNHKSDFEGKALGATLPATEK